MKREMNLLTDGKVNKVQEVYNADTWMYLNINIVLQTPRNDLNRANRRIKNAEKNVYKL